MARSKQAGLSESPQEAAGGSAGGSPRANRTVFLIAGLTALAVLAIAVFAILSTAGGGGDAENFTSNDQGLLPAGSQAPDFTAETVDAGSVSLDDSGGQGATMLVFFATWCPHCNNEAPVISELEGQFEDLRVIMVGMDGRDDPGKVREFVERYGIEGPAVYRPSLGPTYQVSSYPTTYVLDSGNEVVAAHSGEAPRDVYEGWIEEALQGS